MGYISEGGLFSNLSTYASSVLTNTSTIIDDSKYIHSTALTAPTVNSLTKFIASGGTGLGTTLATSKSLIDAIGADGNDVLSHDFSEAGVMQYAHGKHITTYTLLVIPEAVASIGTDNSAIKTELEKLGRVKVITQADALSYPDFNAYTICVLGTDSDSAWVTSNLADLKTIPSLPIICCDSRSAAYLEMGTANTDISGTKALFGVTNIEGSVIGMGLHGHTGLAVGTQDIADANTTFSSLDMSDGDITEVYYGYETSDDNAHVLLGQINRIQSDGTIGVDEEAAEVPASRMFYGSCRSYNSLNTLGKGILSILCLSAIHSRTIGLAVTLCGDIGDLETKILGNLKTKFTNTNPLARFVGTGGTALGQPLPSSRSLIDLIGNYSGPYNGVAQTETIKASLDLAHIDLDSILVNTTGVIGNHSLILDDLSAISINQTAIYDQVKELDVNQSAIIANQSVNLNNVSSVKVQTDSISGRTNEDTLNDLLGLPDVQDLDFYIHTQATRMHDNFNNNTINLEEWGTKVENSSTSINATKGYLKFTNAGTGTGGESYLPTKHKYGKGLSIESDICAWNGESSGDGERCKAFIELYKNVSNYVRFGLYRDESESINSKGYVWYKWTNLGNESLIDADNTSFGNIERNYRIDVTNNNLNFYLEDQLVAYLNYSHLDSYDVRLGAATQNAADVIDVRMDDFQINAYGQVYRDMISRLASIQGGAESIQTVYDNVESVLDYNEEGDSGWTLTDGTEQTLYNATHTRPFFFEGGNINISNASSNASFVLKIYKMLGSGHDMLAKTTTDYGQNTTNPIIEISDYPVRYGTKISIEQTNNSNTSIAHQWFSSL